MKTIKQIKQLVEIFSTNSDSTSNNSLLTSVRDNYIPLFQFNIEAFSSEKAQLVFEKLEKMLVEEHLFLIYQMVYIRKTKLAYRHLKRLLLWNGWEANLVKIL